MSYAFGDDYGQSGLFAGGGAGGTEGNDGATNNSDYLRLIGKAGGGDEGHIEYDGDGYNEDNGTDAEANTGSGGGRGNSSDTTATSGGNGGSGIVIVRFGPI